MGLVADTDFVNKWLEAYDKDYNQAWVAEELSISRQAVSSRGYYLRKHGVDLPTLKKNMNGSGGNHLPARVEVLNKLIKEHKEQSHADQQ